MKEFIFLFPIQEYMDNTHALKYFCCHTDSTNNTPERINEIIKTRYRDQGFCINWLMFKPKGRKKTQGHGYNPKSLSRYIHPTPQDRFLVSNRTFSEMGVGKYTSPAHVLTQIPPPIEQLVIAGFHLNDCVNKFAKSAYEKGIPTYVDEDLTELFFLAIHHPIPLLRTHPQKEDINSQTIRELITFRRRSQPWLSSPPQSFAQ